MHLRKKSVKLASFTLVPHKHLMKKNNTEFHDPFGVHGVANNNIFAELTLHAPLN